MAVIPLEKTTCYKCAKSIMAKPAEVHPLCLDCQESFDDWFEQQLRMFK